MWHAREIRFGLDHPTATGHFPGNPVIPGAVLLDEAVAAIAGGGEAPEITIRSAKFLHPVRPGEAIELRWERRADGETAFEGRLLGDRRLVLSGSLRLGHGAS